MAVLFEEGRGYERRKEKEEIGIGKEKQKKKKKKKKKRKRKHHTFSFTRRFTRWLGIASNRSCILSEGEEKLAILKA